MLITAQATLQQLLQFRPKDVSLEFTDPTSTSPDVKNARKGLLGLIITSGRRGEEEGVDMRSTGRFRGGLVHRPVACGATDWGEEGGGGRRHTQVETVKPARFCSQSHTTHNAKHKTQHNHLTHNSQHTHTRTAKTHNKQHRQGPG